MIGSETRLLTGIIGEENLYSPPLSETPHGINSITNIDKKHIIGTNQTVNQLKTATKAMGTLHVTSTQLAIKQTKMSNERTFLAYMRTGIGIASLAGSFKQWWICAFGIIVITLSSIQYYIINSRLDSRKDPNNLMLENLPLLYVILAFVVLYLQWNKEKK